MTEQPNATQGGPKLKDNAIWMGVGAEPTNKPVSLLLDQANRHGLIAGASGTGKTVTLKVMAEGFSKAGVPVFMADVKGDITGMCSPGEDTEDMQKRIKKFGLKGFTYEGCPCRFWDMLGGQGIPVRITVSDMGPTLLSRLLELTEVQAGVLDIVFRIADDKNLLLIDLKDLRSMLNYVAENAKEYETTYGKVSLQSVGHVGRVSGQEFVALDLRYGAAKVTFLHRTVAHHHDFVHLVGFRLKDNLHRGLVFNVDYLCLVTNHRHLYQGFARRHRDREVAVKVGHCRSLRARHLDCSSYHRLIVACTVQHLSLDNLLRVQAGTPCHQHGAP